MDEIEKFEKKCLQAWGEPLRSYSVIPDSRPNIPEIIKCEYRDISCELKIHIAEKIIRQYFHGGLIPGESNWFLFNFGMEIEWKKGLFDFNRLRPIQSAILLFNQCFPGKSLSDFDKMNVYEHILDGGAPIATIFLVSQLEYIFRKKSRYVNRRARTTSHRSHHCNR